MTGSQSTVGLLLILGVAICFLANPIQAQYDDYDYGGDDYGGDDYGGGDDYYGGDDYGGDDYGGDDYGGDDYGDYGGDDYGDYGGDDYNTDPEPVDPDYDNDYGSGGEGDIETNKNTTLTCSTCFIPRPIYCSWTDGGGSSLRFPSFIRHYRPQPVITISFGSWGSLSNRYRQESSANMWGSRWGSGGHRWSSGLNGWSSGGGGGRYSNYWDANRWMGGNSCMWSGSSCGGVGSTTLGQVPSCGGSCNTSCGGLVSNCGGSSGSSGRLWSGKGWFQRSAASQKLFSNKWSSSGRGGGRRPGYMGGGGFGGMGGGGRGSGGGSWGFGQGSSVFNRFSSKWSQRYKQNNRYMSGNMGMVMGGGGGNSGCNQCGSGSCNSCGNGLKSGLSIFKSWFG